MLLVTVSYYYNSIEGGINRPNGVYDILACMHQQGQEGRER